MRPHGGEHGRDGKGQSVICVRSWAFERANGGFLQKVDSQMADGGSEVAFPSAK